MAYNTYQIKTPKYEQYDNGENQKREEVEKSNFDKYRIASPGELINPVIIDEEGVGATSIGNLADQISSI